MQALQKTDATKYTSACGAIREDGVYVEAGENDILIVRKLEANADAFGIFGYSFLAENEDKIKGNEIGGVKPTFDNIVGAKYPVSRPLFFYVKKAHIGVIPGLKEYIEFFVSDEMAGPDGPLAEYGLVPDPELAALRKDLLTQQLANEKAKAEKAADGTPAEEDDVPF